MKFNMAATAGLSLTLDPMGKMFQNASSLKPLGELKSNCPGMIIGRSSTIFFIFYADRKSKMAATAIEFHIGTKNVRFVEDHLIWIIRYVLCTIYKPVLKLFYLLNI
jgi:hypothetical protein